MLDTFLKVAYDHEKTAAGKEYTVDLLKQLPNDYLQALASGEVKLAHLGCGSGGDYEWLEKFKGSPLFDQALQLEQKTLEMDLQKQQTNNERRQMWDQQDQEMDQLRIQKKLLDLQLVQQEGQTAAGGMPAAEGAPPELPVEAAPPEAAPPGPPAAAANPVSVKVGSISKTALTAADVYRRVNNAAINASPKRLNNFGKRMDIARDMAVGDNVAKGLAHPSSAGSASKYWDAGTAANYAERAKRQGLPVKRMEKGGAASSKDKVTAKDRMHAGARGAAFGGTLGAVAHEVNRRITGTKSHRGLVPNVAEKAIVIGGLAAALAKSRKEKTSAEHEKHRVTAKDRMHAGARGAVVGAAGGAVTHEALRRYVGLKSHKGLVPHIAENAIIIGGLSAAMAKSRKEKTSAEHEKHRATKQVASLAALPALGAATGAGGRALLSLGVKDTEPLTAKAVKALGEAVPSAKEQLKNLLKNQKAKPGDLAHKVIRGAGVGGAIGLGAAGAIGANHLIHHGDTEGHITGAMKRRREAAESFAKSHSVKEGSKVASSPMLNAMRSLRSAWGIEKDSAAAPAVDPHLGMKLKDAPQAALNAVQYGTHAAGDWVGKNPKAALGGAALLAGGALLGRASKDDRPRY